MRIIVKDYRKPQKPQPDIYHHVLLQNANETQQTINTMLQTELNKTPITVTIKTATETVHVQVPPQTPPTPANIYAAVVKALEVLNIKP